VFTCLALGVAIAYGLCNLLFASMRLRTVKPVAAAAKIAGIARV
jgi:hypothetical protein